MGIRKMNPKLTPEFWLKGWLSDKHIKWRTQCWSIIDNYLDKPPQSILDIGCGTAVESRLFYKKYNSELWLLDGNNKNNNDQQTKTVGYNNDVKKMAYYTNHEDLKKIFDGDKIKNYNLVDADNITIPEDKKFDLICSYSSCGIHYPLQTYKSLILKHSHDHTVLIFDLRNRTLPMLAKDIQIINILQNPAPSDPMNSAKVHFKFKND